MPESGNCAPFKSEWYGIDYHCWLYLVSEWRTGSSLGQNFVASFAGNNAVQPS
jgi:hypothetical protein